MSRIFSDGGSLMHLFNLLFRYSLRMGQSIRPTSVVIKVDICVLREPFSCHQSFPIKRMIKNVMRDFFSFKTSSFLLVMSLFFLATSRTLWSVRIHFLMQFCQPTAVVNLPFGLELCPCSKFSQNVFHKMKETNGSYALCSECHN